ncbi:MAG: hypothetical protein CMP17_04180 [Rickettsiales bacterium]|jgi:hypothetical protein|nr:hypothetical protein [Rickettsiales bacterium]|tara:strand:- start:1336 stop:1650 length:315 start_codon:yes stop_codon:yes gene_type:complete
MKIDLLVLHNDSCPSLDPTLKRINEIIDDNHLKANLSTKLLKNDQEAHQWKFAGSPTIYINKVQFEPIDSNLYRLENCRTFINDEGKISPLPSKNKLLKAFLEA